MTPAAQDEGSAGHGGEASEQIKRVVLVTNSIDQKERTNGPSNEEL